VINNQLDNTAHHRFRAAHTTMQGTAQQHLTQCNPSQSPLPTKANDDYRSGPCNLHDKNSGVVQSASETPPNEKHN